MTYRSMTLEEGKDFTTEYKDNTEASTDGRKAKVTLTGKGNYTGTREETFTIIKTASPTATPSSHGSSGGYRGGSSGSGFGGFDGESEDIDEEETDEEGDSEDGIDWIPAPDGNIRVNEMDYGTVLYGVDGLSRPFSIYIEDYIPEVAEDDEFDGFDDEGDGETNFDEAENDNEIELDDEGTDDENIDIVDEGEESLTLKRVMIKADSMKTSTGDGPEEDILLEGTDRMRYEDLHLRLSDSIVQGMINNGIGEIVYELEQARLRIPLSALSSRIVLPADETEAEEDGEGSDVEDEIEIEDEADETEAVGEIAANDSGISVDTGAEGKTLPVDGYDITIEQADASGLSEREQALIGDNKLLMPAYRVRVRIIPEDAQQSPTGETDENGEPVTVPVTETLPENYTLPGVVLQLVPNDRYNLAPDEAQVLHAAIELATAEDSEALEANAQAPEEDGETTSEDEEILTEDVDNLEENIGGTMVASNPALANAIERNEASLTPAMFNEEDEPMKVEVEPVEDGLYVTIVPPDWDPTPVPAWRPKIRLRTIQRILSKKKNSPMMWTRATLRTWGETTDDEEVEFDDADEEEFVEFWN